MKSTGTQYWQPINIGATNESGFSGLPGGRRDNFYTGFNGSWWSASESGAEAAWGRYLLYGNVDIYRYNYVKWLGFSVRCLRD
jgi:uncharacterized protein (TIGR02145 family)